MSTFIKNQSSWKLTQLKKLTFDELKTEFEKLVKSIENFVPMETDERVKRQVIAKEEEIEKSIKKRGKIRKQKARNGIHIDKIAQDESEEEREAFMKDKVTSASSKSKIRIDVIPTATKPLSIKYGVNRPKEIYDRVFWGDLKTMFDLPLSDDAIWSLPLQQKMINWRYYPSCVVHCLTLDDTTILMLADRKYPLLKDAFQVMLKMKLLDGTTDEVCYQLLKMIDKQAGLKQMATGKEISNPLTADSLLKTIREDEMLLKIKSQISSASTLVSTGRRVSIIYTQTSKMAEQDTPPPTITAMKIPIIKKGEYDIWSMRMRQYICHTDHNLWDIIVNGDLQEEPAPTGDQSGPSAPPVPKTAKQLAAKRNQERVKSILLLAIPDEYLLKFHNVPDAKSLWVWVGGVVI
ncbi:hypothetical protein Tco_0949466 [Tanacetum coccineum]